MNRTVLYAIVLLIVAGSGYALYSIQQQTAEEEFNASGRAKAVEQESDLWPTHHDDAAGIMLGYPPEVTLDEDGKAGDTLRLTVSAMSIADMPESAPMGHGTDTALPNMTALEKGELGRVVDFSIPDSEKVRTLKDGINAQEYMVVARFEVCDVTFQRILNFFNNDHQVTVTVHGPKATIVAENPQYFTTDSENCGDETIWNFDKQADFYATLKAGTLGGTAQTWFDTFDDIADTIQSF